MYLTDADAEGERLPALVAGVEHRAVLQPPRVVRLDELALLGGGAGAHDAVAEAEPGGGHRERALPRRGLRRRREQDGPGQHCGHGLAPAEDERAGVLGGGAGRRVCRSVGVGKAEEDAGQRRGGGSHGCPAQLARSAPWAQVRANG
jgi:hypothetical protein